MDTKHRHLRAQYMLPAQLIAQRQRLALVFLPVAGLEWHGPHLTVGTDGLNAQSTALQVAARVGGVVMPTLYMSTERERPPQTLRSLGLDPEAHVVGMDFPSMPDFYPSQYFPEEVFALTLSAHIEMYISHGYRYVFIINGHGAVNHNAVITRLCHHYSHQHHDVAVDYAMAFPTQQAKVGGIAHAGKVETSLMMNIDPQLADVSRLPAKPEPLAYHKYGVVDEGGFTGDPGPDFTVKPQCDPRDATAALGQSVLQQTVSDIVSKVQQLLNHAPSSSK